MTTRQEHAARIHQHALNQRCPQCGAAPGAECVAPRKQAKQRRKAALLTRFGMEHQPSSPLSVMHVLRVDAGVRIYRTGATGGGTP